MSSDSLRSLGASWLRNEPEAKRFLPCFYNDSAQRAIHVKSAASNSAHPAVIEALRKNLSPAHQIERPRAKAALDKIAEGKAAVVVTGQQAGFLLGPRYTFHKILSAISIAKNLEKETGIACVPVFWVQDEDHDFDEAASFAWVSHQGFVRESHVVDEKPRVPVGDREIPQSITSVLDDIDTDLGKEAYGHELRALLDIWRSCTRWSDAFCDTVEAVFKDEPLLVLRGRDLHMCEAARGYYQKSLQDSAEIEQLLVEQTDLVKKSGFRVQVPILSGRPLCFYQPEDENGSRFRFVSRSDEKLSIREKVWSFSDINQELHDNPLRFSTSALLRPLVQDGLLPVAGQVVGPGEAAYLAQIEKLRTLFKRPAPMIIPRGQAVWVEPMLNRRLKALNASIRDVMDLDSDQFLSARATSLSAIDPNGFRENVLTTLQKHFSELGELPPELLRAQERTFVSLRRNVDRFTGRLVKHCASLDHDAARRWGEARAWLKPNGHPQERYLGIMDLIARYGTQRLKDMFMDSYQPYSRHMLELYL